MKKIVIISLSLIVALIFCMGKTFAQSGLDTTVNLDVLTIPNSPAFNLLGVNPSDVDKPSTPADFAFSIANATNNLTQLPANYAIEFLPVSFFKKHQMSYTKFTNDGESSSFNKLRNNIAQTFTVSSGFATDDSVDTSVPDFIATRNGTGFKFSIIRGKIDTAFEDYKDSISLIRQTLNLIHSNNLGYMNSLRNNDEIYQRLSQERSQIMQDLLSNNDNLVLLRNKLNPDLPKRETDSINQLIDNFNSERSVLLSSLSFNASSLTDRIDKIKEEHLKKETDDAKRLKQQIENLKFKRYGFVLDFAGGFVLGFRNNDFTNSIVQQYALWLNGGYSFKKNFSIMGLLRNTNDINAYIDEKGNATNKSIWDVGSKLEFTTTNEKFSLTGEYILRAAKNYKPVYRYSINASYQVGKNQALTFSVGKAFIGPDQFGGNLIATLNYVRSFGSKRTITPSR